MFMEDMLVEHEMIFFSCVKLYLYELLIVLRVFSTNWGILMFFFCLMGEDKIRKYLDF